ncbi:hypothetical protein [Asaia astilbis]|uniref:hypothetical protein n=1 Tax=Asaia astilbis TaxID=610244 RepID=UPI0012EB8BA7|nr:hypothetical protein [Asaia astilbis]
MSASRSDTQTALDLAALAIAALGTLLEKHAALVKDTDPLFLENFEAELMGLASAGSTPNTPDNPRPPTPRESDVKLLMMRARS